jgi:hypothetical protein
MNTTLRAAGIQAQPVALAGFGLLSAIALAIGVVQWPWLASGLVFGLILLGIVLVQPLALIALMLALGPIDLSFMTGGFKTLFAGIGGLDMNGIRLVGVTGGFLALGLADKRVQRMALGAHGIWYLLFLVWAAASLATTYSTVEGLRLLLKLAYPFFTFLVVATMVEREEQLDRLMTWTLATGAIIVLLINPLFVFGGSYTVDPEGFRRVRGVGAHENPFSFYLSIILMISFARFVVRGQMRYLVLCVMSGFWIVLTMTRITLAGLFAGLAAMAVYYALAARNYRALVAGCLIAVSLGSVLIPRVFRRSFGYVPTPTELVALTRSPGRLYEALNWQGREVLWPIVYHRFRQDPVTGLGLGSSTVVVRESFPSYYAQVVHNEYLRLATDTGLVGVGLYFLAVMAWAVGVTRSGWRAGNRVREYALPALGGLAAWVFIAITDNAFDYYAPFTQYIGFLCAGAICAARLERQAPPAEAHA